MPIPLRNPYRDSTAPLIPVTAKVSLSDKALFDRLFPNNHGLQDCIVSQLYHDLVHRLRTALQLPADSYSPTESDVAWHTDHPSWDLLRGLLGGATRQPDDGASGPRDDARAVGGVYKGVRVETTECSGPPDISAQGSRDNGSEEGVEEEKGQRVAGDGPAKPAKRARTFIDLLEQLKEGLQ